VSETRNGYPQFIAKITATEYYDEAAGTWEDWSQYEAEITAFLVLYTKDDKSPSGWKELFKAKQIKDALGWNGADFAALANGDYSKTPILFRVENSEYQGVNRLQVQWIDEANSDPVRQLQKYDATKLAGMNAKFAGVLGTPAATPAKAPSTPATPPARRGRPPKNPTTGATAPSAAPANGAAPSVPPVPASPAPAPAAPSGDPPPPTTPVTKASAWMAVSTNELRMDAYPDDKLAEVWVNAVTAIGKDEATFTPADWAKVQAEVLKQTSKF
jgi:hypothetical protein